MSSSTITGFKLSSRQRHIWQQQSQLDYALTAQCTIAIHGDLNVLQLQTALQSVVNDHEIFRTVFQETPGLVLPLQVIQPEGDVVWKQVDLVTVADQADAMAPHREAERLQVMAADKASVRAVLFKQSEQRHILLLTLPAMWADTETYGILLTQLSHHYRGLPLAEDPVQYVQFATWQDQLLSEVDEETQAAQAFWQQQGSLAYQAAQPPFRYRGEKGTNFEPRVYRIELANEVEDALGRIAPEPESVLLTAWLILLWRHREQSELALGVVCEGRQDEDLAEACGPFANTLPLQVQMSSVMTFSALLRQVKQTWQDLHEWQDYWPMEQPGASTLPLGFEFAVQPDVVESAEISFSLEHRWVYGDCSELKLMVVQTNNGFVLEFHYDEAVIGRDAIAALSNQFHALLADASQRPTAPIGSLCLKSELGSLVSNVPSKTLTVDACIHHRIEQQAEKTPDALALVYEDQQITYQELNHQANQLAHYLQTLGAGPEVPVALYLDRSPQLMIALVAILKTGSAYLAMDLALPWSGVNYRLEDAQAKILITQQLLLEDTEITSSQVVCLERDGDVIAQQSDKNPTSAVEPANIAYVLYTSGSTGQPKGVAVEHRQLIAYVDSVTERLDLPAVAHYATVSTVAADLGNTMIFPCLCQGGTLHLISAERVSDAQALGDYVEQHPIDCLKIVPSHLKALLQIPNAKSFLPRQRLVLGGEICPWPLVEQVQQLAPGCRIFNHYGPTETTVGVLTYAFDPLARSAAMTVPLGQGLAHSRIYLLDADLNPVPVGIPGEIYIGGESVARGYLQRPKLTADRFMQDPFSGQPGARMYRTGDLARYQPDGNLEFLRRADLQVKLHGFRIELGEIEAQLLQYADVQTVSAIVRADDPDNPLLVAYIVPEPGTMPTGSDLRPFLLQRLPKYMIPSVFVTLTALPLTPNGKVDRKALPAPERLRPELAKQYVAPRNPTEEAIAAIWMDVLSLETIGVDDDFFDLGGHSLLATQVLSRLREAFQVELPLRQLFEAHTVAEIAVVIETALLAEIEAMTDEEAQELIQQG